MWVRSWERQVIDLSLIRMILTVALIAASLGVGTWRAAMSGKDPHLDDALDGGDERRRETLTRLITGTSFVAPLVISFAMQTVSASATVTRLPNGSGVVPPK